MKNTLLIFLFSLSACIQLAAQDFKDWYKTQVGAGEKLLWTSYQHLSVKTPDGLYVRKTFYPEKKILTHRITYADKKHKIKHGLYQEWYDNGYPWMEGRYENDQPEGEWSFYAFANGTLEAKGAYVQGLKKGKWIYLDTSGIVITEEHFADGKLHGEWKRFNKEGELIKTRIFQNGEIISEESFEAFAPADTMKITLPFLKGCEHEDPEEQKACSEQKMLESIYRQIKYPQKARVNDVQGTAVIRFVIEKDGSISGITTMRGICEEIENECIRVVGLLPEWSPGTQKGESVRVQFNLPIKFKLE